MFQSIYEVAAPQPKNVDEDANDTWEKAITGEISRTRNTGSRLSAPARGEAAYERA